MYCRSLKRLTTIDALNIVSKPITSHLQHITHYYTTREISSANMGFGSANIGRYYMVQQLIAQLHQRTVKRQLNAE